jgi:hypothetical protein
MILVMRMDHRKMIRTKLTPAVTSKRLAQTAQRRRSGGERKRRQVPQAKAQVSLPLGLASDHTRMTAFRSESENKSSAK